MLQELSLFKFLQRFIVHGYSCGQEGSPVASDAVDLKKALTQDTCISVQLWGVSVMDKRLVNRIVVWEKNWRCWRSKNELVYFAQFITSI